MRGNLQRMGTADANSFKLPSPHPGQHHRDGICSHHVTRQRHGKWKSLAQTAGVKFLRQEENCAVLVIESGEYRFEAKR